tara:strand:- start:53 stop:514 length:462 start_codon:yes stop_codon:yes gene_type:complete
MGTKFIKLLLLLLTITTTFSCSKESKNHKVKFQLRFIEVPKWYSTSYLGVTASPHYENEYNGDGIAPYITREQTLDGIWEYEYWELKDGDEVFFELLAQKKYHYEMRVFIDDTEVSYKRFKMSDDDFFQAVEYEERGWDETKHDYDIRFTYRE